MVHTQFSEKNWIYDSNNIGCNKIKWGPDRSGSKLAITFDVVKTPYQKHKASLMVSWSIHNTLYTFKISSTIYLLININSTMHRGLKFDGAIGDFAEPLWRQKTGHFTK